MQILKFVGLVALIAVPAAGQAPVEARGDMDALLGPATRVDQGRGMTDELRAALAPGPEHDLLHRLLGVWKIEGIAGRDGAAVEQEAEFTSLFDGAWVRYELRESGEVIRVGHFGYDAFRGSYAMWEMGRGFTSPQVRAGRTNPDTHGIDFRRQYTIQVRGEERAIEELLAISFLSEARFRWVSRERVGDRSERLQKDVVFSRVQ